MEFSINQVLDEMGSIEDTEANELQEIREHLIKNSRLLHWILSAVESQDRPLSYRLLDAILIGVRIGQRLKGETNHAAVN